MSNGGSQKTCCGSLFSFLLAAGFVILIYWAIFQPHHIRATVASATLTNLTVASSNATVSYRLAVNLDLYNPSLRVGIYYDALDAQLRARGGASLGAPVPSSPNEFLQRRKSSDTVRLEFDRSNGVSVPSDVAGELQREAGEGVVSFEVAVDAHHARVRYRFASIKIRRKPKIWCALTVNVKPEGSGSIGGALASSNRCSVKY